EARLARKGAGKEAKLSYAGHVEMDNRHGLVVNTRLTPASGRAEPEAALAMVEEIAGFGRVTLGADKGYDQKELVRELREHRVTPHVAQKPSSAIDTLVPRAARPASCHCLLWRQRPAPGLVSQPRGQSRSPSRDRLVAPALSGTHAQRRGGQNALARDS